MKVKSESEVAQSCPTLSNPMACSLQGSSVCGIFQERVLEWGAITVPANLVTEENNKGSGYNLHIPRLLFYRHPFKFRVVLLLHIEYEGLHIEYLKDVPGGSDGKESACSAGDLYSISGSGRSPGEGNGYPLQYSCLENFMTIGAWEATVHGATKSQTQLSD